MKFSIVIPVYNVETYLRQCIDSILCQTFTDYEIILVDDGSTDNCPLICDEYAAKDKRIKVIHQENAGQSVARNTAINSAKGEYLICLDSDDWLSDNEVLESIHKSTFNNPDIVEYGYRKYFESNESLGGIVAPDFDNSKTLSEKILISLRSESYGGMAWTKAVKLQILHENGIEFRPGMVGEDVDWFLNILCKAKSYVSLNRACVIYRQRSDSTSHAPKPQALTDFIWILETWPKRFEEEVKDVQLKNVLMSVMAYYYPNLLILYSNREGEVAKPNRERVKSLSYLQQYAITSRALTVRKFYKVLGFDMTVALLRLLSRIKKRQ